MGDNIVINGGTINGGVVQEGNTTAEAGASVSDSDRPLDVRTDKFVEYSGRF